MTYRGVSTTGPPPSAALTLTKDLHAPRARYYSPSISAYKAWGGSTVKLYSRNSDGTWALRKTVTASSSGVATAKVYQSGSRTWKAVVQETGSIWGKTSNTSTR